MTSLVAEPARAESIRAALSQWHMFARAAEQDARHVQRALSLDLLQAARHLAAGLESLQRLEAQHVQHRRILRNLHASAGHAADRIDRRLAMVEDLAAAASRAVERAADGPHVERSRAEQALALATAHVALLAAEHDRARHTLAELGEVLADHDAAETELADLRAEFTQLRAEAERGLALTTSAGAQLNGTSCLYEAAQLQVADLRRAALPGPFGPRFDIPMPHASGSPVVP